MNTNEIKTENNRLICDFFEYVLKIDKEKVQNYADNLEKSADKEVFDKLCDFLNFMEKCDKPNPEYAKAFELYEPEKGSCGCCYCSNCKQKN